MNWLMKVRVRQQASGIPRVGVRPELGLNGSSVDDSPNSPFGGEKNSGIGRFGSEWVIKEFTTDHWVTVQHTPRPYPF